MKKRKSEPYINQNLVIWACGMFVLFVDAEYGINCIFCGLGALVSTATTISLLICLVAYTFHYWNKKVGVKE